MSEINWQDFTKVELRVGTIIKAEPYPEAHKPAYKLQIDFGPELGILKSSAQITHHYTPETLTGTQIIAVTNFPPKQIGKFLSQCLVTGFPDQNGNIILSTPQKQTPNGARLI